MTVKFSSWCLDLQLCHLVQCVDFHRVCLVVIPILEIHVRSCKFTETQVIREPNQYNISELSLIFNHVTPSIVNIYFPLTKYIISCPSISLQKNTHIPSQGHFLEFEPPQPPLWESWESCFPFKTLTFETPCPSEFPVTFLGEGMDLFKNCTMKICTPASSVSPYTTFFSKTLYSCRTISHNTDLENLNYFHVM